MNEFIKNLQLHSLISTYFSDPLYQQEYETGDALTLKGVFNDKLFLVIKGRFAVSHINTDGEKMLLYHIEEGMFAGILSFFSKAFIGVSDVVAVEPSKVAYIDRNTKVIKSDGGNSLQEQFMPIIISDMARRQTFGTKMLIEKERALKNMIENEKMASLGQMAAGITHELNNAIAVIDRSAEWLKTNVGDLATIAHPEYASFFKLGLSEGRKLSTRDIRKNRRELKKKYDFSDELLEKLSESAIDPKTVKAKKRDFENALLKASELWEIGATLRGMQLAAVHAGHVAKSVKTLGAKSYNRLPDQDVNESIAEALILLRSKLRRVILKSAYGKLPLITANRGELVQIWVNIVKNAVESLLSAPEIEMPSVSIVSSFKKKYILVKISDNGPGIPPNLLPTIFQPNVTTKISGLTFGLGLGLSIVQRIVKSYNGDISVKSVPGRTEFLISIPVNATQTVENYLKVED